MRRQQRENVQYYNDSTTSLYLEGQMYISEDGDVSADGGVIGDLLCIISTSLSWIMAA